MAELAEGGGRLREPSPRTMTASPTDGCTVAGEGADTAVDAGQHCESFGEYTAGERPGSTDRTSAPTSNRLDGAQRRTLDEGCGRGFGMEPRPCTSNGDNHPARIDLRNTGQNGTIVAEPIALDPSEALRFSADTQCDERHYRC